MVGNCDGLFEDGEETIDAIARRIIIVVGIARGAITAVFRVSLTSVHGFMMLVCWVVLDLEVRTAGVLVCDERKVEKAGSRATRTAGFVTGA